MLAQRAQVPFDQALKAIDEYLPEKNVFLFQKLVGGNLDLGRELLGLITMRALLEREKPPGESLEQDAKKLLSDGLAALGDTLPWYSPHRMQVWLLATLGKYVPGIMSAELLRGVLMGAARSRLGIDAHYKDVFELLRNKEMYTLGLQYRAQEDELDARLAAAPVHTLAEAIIIKRASLNHPESPRGL